MVIDINRLDNHLLEVFNSGINGVHRKKKLDNYYEQELANTIRKITSRLAIYRKLKELGHSDDTIFSIYHLSNKEN